ncbi:MAG: sensor histidine kinase [Anaerolineales bacterium]|nr:sensor histidine kinase [Anaerolineales bacterium]
MPSLKKSSRRLTTADQRSVWERWTVAWHAAFFITLVVPVVLALLTPETSPERGLPFSPPWLVGLSLALGAWYGLVMVWLLRRQPPNRMYFWSTLYVIGAIAVWFPLSRMHWAFFITASAIYGVMWGTMPFGLAAAGNLILTGLIIYSQALNIGGTVQWTLEGIVVVTMTVGWSTLLALWMRSIVRESANRKRLIEQLEVAQQELASVERQAGILSERQRLAGEIHDSLAQGFTSIVMQLEAADQALPEEASIARRHVQQARDTARLNLEEARRLVQALQPASLDGASLPEALRRTSQRWSAESGVAVEFAVTGDPCPLHPEAEVTLLRATQEALANIRKHAQAHQVSITLSYMHDRVALDVQDDGRGFQTPAASKSPGGFGLQSMHQRVERLGGELVIESAPGQGATIAVQLPLVEK